MENKKLFFFCRLAQSVKKEVIAQKVSQSKDFPVY
jgi:hypothetical protein